MVLGNCDICKKLKELNRHHNPSKNTLPEEVGNRVIEWICKECHEDINSVERKAIRIVKKQGPFVTSANDLDSLKNQLKQGQIPTLNEKDTFIVAAGSVTFGSIIPKSGTDTKLISRNLYQKDNWKKSDYGWGIAISHPEEIENIREGSVYTVSGSPSGYNYNVDIFMRKNLV